MPSQPPAANAADAAAASAPSDLQGTARCHRGPLLRWGPPRGGGPLPAAAEPTLGGDDLRAAPSGPPAAA